MSDWASPTRCRRPNRLPVLVLGSVVGCALAVGSIPGLAAQPQDPPPASDAVDPRPPLPPEPPVPPDAAKYRFPNPDRRIFAGIKDDAPVQSEKDNPDEYQAWTEVVLHARQFSAAELERHGDRGFTPDDLIRNVTDRGRALFRVALVRFDGRLTKVRKLEPTRALAEAGLKAVYEGWLVPVDESPARPVCVVFTDLPPGLELGPQPADRWASFAGYFFKVMTYPGPHADPNKPDSPAWLPAPLLVGRSVTLLGGPPESATAVPLDKELRIFKRIEDPGPYARAERNWEEVAAWNRVLLHARRFPPEQLEAAARRDLGFADLFKEVRRDYRLDLVYLEGRLVRVRKLEPSDRMREAGVAAAYEGWLIPRDEPHGHPVCVVFSELPDGFELYRPGQRPLDRWVSFAGYSFKLLQYESGEDRKDDPTRKVWKQAPLLIGHAVVPRPDPAEGLASSWWSSFSLAAAGGLGLIVGAALALSWWFRRGDRATRREIEAARPNPFAQG
jgi:hypothetical protein